MVLDPALFVVFTCAQSVAVVIHSFIYSVIQLLLFNSPQIMIVPKDLKLKSNNSIHDGGKGREWGGEREGDVRFFPEPTCQP